jgi:hypothetical protein
MGISNTADISAVLTTAFGPDLVRLWNRRANTLANVVNIDEGQFPTVLWAVSPAGGASKAVAEGYTVLSSDNNIDSMVNMNLARAQYIDAFALSDKEVAVAARSPLSPTKLIDMLAERTFESLTRLTDRVNTDLFAGTGTDGVTGAQTVVGFDSALITSGTYAGQNVGSITSLQSNVFGGPDAGSGVALTLTQMQQDLTAIKIKSDEKPDFIVMHPYVGSQLEALFETNRRIVNLDMTLNRYSTGPAQAFNGADSGMTFMGVPVLYDKDGYTNGTPGAGFGHIYYLSKRHLDLDVMPHHNPGDAAMWEQSSFLSSGGAEDERVGGPVVSITALARNGLFSQFVLNVECQLKVKRPLALGRRLNVAI